MVSGHNFNGGLGEKVFSEGYRDSLKNLGGGLKQGISGCNLLSLTLHCGYFTKPSYASDSQ